MKNVKLVLATSKSYGVPTERQIELFHNAGFDGFFTDFKCDTETPIYRKKANELGMIYQSIHAPFTKMKGIWHGTDEEAKECVDELISCVETCADNDVPLTVIHAFIGFRNHEPNDRGVEYFSKVVKRAGELGIKLALENTEGEEYLALLMDAFKNEKHVGFCWDTGHEMCYNNSKDMMALYGNRIMSTHINDNLGIRDYSGEITYIDDLHLLPFDGIGNWQDIASRLKKYSFTDTLTFELTLANKPDRHEHDVYCSMPIESFIAECFKRACRVGALVTLR